MHQWNLLVDFPALVHSSVMLSGLSANEAFVKMLQWILVCVKIFFVYQAIYEMTCNVLSQMLNSTQSLTLVSEQIDNGEMCHELGCSSNGE